MFTASTNREIARWLTPMLCRLIMLLVLGDLVRAMWYFVHAIVSVGHGAISTSSPFCQTSGFMVQWGTEATGTFLLCSA